VVALSFSRKGLAGCIDYLAGYERSLLLFYLLLISLAAWFGELALRLGDHRCQRRSVGVIRSFGSHPSCRFWNARTAFVSFRIIDDEIGFRSSFKKATDLGDGEDAGHFALCPRLCGALRRIVGRISRLQGKIEEADKHAP